MKKLMVSVITAIIVISSGYVNAMKTVKVYPDYTIYVKLDVYEETAYVYYYKVSISLRNNMSKTMVKAWDIHDSITDVKIDSSGELKTFVKKFEKNREEENYTSAFNYAVESAFHIALIIQDAGMIPQIDFKEFDLTYDDGRMTFFRNFVNVKPTGIPTGEWRDVK